MSYLLDKTELSIIIVTWNSEEEIAECLRSISDQKNTREDFRFEIIIIDNNSSDNTIKVVEKYKNCFNENITITRNSKNLGFTKACNQGLELVTGENVLFLNPDTEVIDDAMINMNNFLNSNEKVGAVAPQLLNDDMTIQYTCRTLPKYKDMFFELMFLSTIFPRDKFFSRWKMRYFSHDKLCEVEQPMAAALIVKKNILDSIHNMDERFFMFFNDVDLCKKILDSGYKILFYPEAKIIHKKGLSVYKNRKHMIKIWNQDCLKYFKKHNENFILYPLLLIALKISGFLRVIVLEIRRR
jgi:GT2 family glycosyltransferase